MAVLERDSKYRHGNCVPFIVTNVKTGTINFKGSLKEVAKHLKISAGRASMAHRNDRSVTKGRSKYKITRLGFDTTIHLF